MPELLPVPPVQGGAVEHWVDEASARMAGPQRKITVVSRPAGQAGREGIGYIGIPWTTAERWFQRIKDKVSWRNPLRYVAKIQNVWSYGRRVAAAVTPFDVVIVHNEPNILLFLRRRPGQKLVLHMHNEHLGIRLFRPLYRRALHKVDLILCVSDYIRRQAVAIFPEHAHRFQVLFNSTDPAVFQPYADAAEVVRDAVTLDPAQRYLLYVGRLTALKGVHVLIEAFSAVRRTHPDVKLIITGSSFFGGAARTDYERQLEELAKPVNDGIVFTGYLPHQKLRYLYAAVDMIVLPSVWQDPCPLVVLEAMASGTLLLSSAVGGIPEVVEHRVNGLLVPPNDAPALAAAIGAALDDPEARSRMSTAARAKIVQGYTWERLVNELNDSLDTLK
ncbi:glycosyltransferase family 4 protein [Oxalobacteraceae bacterium A2-2]